MYTYWVFLPMMYCFFWILQKVFRMLLNLHKICIASYISQLLSMPFLGVLLPNHQVESIISKQKFSFLATEAVPVNQALLVTGVLVILIPEHNKHLALFNFNKLIKNNLLAAVSVCKATFLIYKYGDINCGPTSEGYCGTNSKFAKQLVSPEWKLWKYIIVPRRLVMK